jgi:hypothetical protein
VEEDDKEEEEDEGGETQLDTQIFSSQSPFIDEDETLQSVVRKRKQTIS